MEPPASVYTAPAADVGAVIGGQTATILLPNGFTLGSIAVVTQGAPNLDFKFVSGGTCTVGSTYTADEVCTVNYSFNPTVPGLRIGAVNLYDNTTPTPVLQATVYLNGTGVGPQLVFNTPLTANSLGSGSGFNNPYGAAVDGSGNLYVADAGNNLVTERPAGCASLSCVTTLGGGFSRPTGVAVDGSGNVYVADQGNSAVKEMPSGCASSSCVTTLGGGFSRPTGVAVDGSGNVYVADQSNNAIKEMPSGCTTSGCVTTLGGNIPTPYAVAVDSSGNVWVPAGDNVLHEITPGCTSSSCVGALSLLSRSGAQSVALDGAGDIYIAEILPNDSNNVVLELPVGCTSASCVITVGSGLVHPVGLAVDGSGNLYVADEVGVAQGSVDGNVKEIARATAPSLSFATTPAGAISSDSPQTVTVENVGNAALTFPIPASGKDPSITTGFTLNSSASGACPLVTPTSSTPGSLAAGASCSLAISFKPVTSGSATGSLTLTDQNLNTPGPNYAVQSIQLSGNSTPGSPTINSVSAILPQQTQTITINGSDFGTQAAYTGDSNYIELVDSSGTPWNAGHGTSAVTLAVSSWTNTQIVLIRLLRRLRNERLVHQPGRSALGPDLERPIRARPGGLPGGRQRRTQYMHSGNQLSQPNPSAADADHYHQRIRLRHAGRLHRRLELHRVDGPKRNLLECRSQWGRRNPGRLLVDQYTDRTHRLVRRIRNAWLVHQAGRSAFDPSLECPKRAWAGGLPDYRQQRDKHMSLIWSDPID